MACNDINECNTANGGCDTNATCANTTGGRTCTCNSGFFGNGVVCTTARVFAVVRVGAVGGAPLTNASTEVHLEFRDLTTGALLSETPLPTATSGANNPLTMSGVATGEGVLNLSTNGAYLLLTGYSTAPGYPAVSTSIASTLPRVVGRITASGSINTVTLINDGYSQGIRSAASVDGTGYWLGGTSATTGGVRYVVQGSLGTSTEIYAARLNVRVTQIAGGQLYATSSNPAFPDAGVEYSHLYGVGTGLPTSLVTTYSSFAGVTTTAPTNFVMFDRSTLINGLDTLYLGETGVTAVRRYEFNGATWVESANFPLPSGSAYFMTVAGTGANTVVLATGSPGIVRWDDNGVMGTAPVGTVLVPPTSATAFRGLVVP